MKTGNYNNGSALEKEILKQLIPQLTTIAREAVHLVLAEPPAEKPAKPVRRTRNGVTEPPHGGKCMAIWEYLDGMVKAGGQVPKVNDATAAAREQGLNEGNVRCEYYYWRRFHGYGKKSQSVAANNNKKSA